MFKSIIGAIVFIALTGCVTNFGKKVSTGDYAHGEYFAHNYLYKDHRRVYSPYMPFGHHIRVYGPYIDSHSGEGLIIWNSTITQKEEK